MQLSSRVSSWTYHQPQLCEIILALIYRWETLLSIATQRITPNTWWPKTRINIHYLAQFLWLRHSEVAELRGSERDPPMTASQDAGQSYDRLRLAPSHGWQADVRPLAGDLRSFTTWISPSGFLSVLTIWLRAPPSEWGIQGEDGSCRPYHLWPFFSVQFRGVKNICMVVQPLPPSIYPQNSFHRAKLTLYTH